MKRSDEDIDRLLDDWHRIAATARPTAHPATRRTVRGGSAAVPASLLAVVLVAIVAIGVIGRDRPAPEATPGPGAATIGALPGPVSASVTEDSFRLVLTADHAAYEAGDAIDASVTVEFLGPESSRQVEHASAAVVYSVREVDGPRRINGGTRMLGAVTTFDRGNVVAFPWSKSGSPDGENAIDGYFVGNDLRLPVGRWELEAALADLVTTSVTVTVVADGDVAALLGAPVGSSAADNRFTISLNASGSVYRESDTIGADGTITFLGPEAEATIGNVNGPLVFDVQEVDGDRGTRRVSSLGACVMTTYPRLEPTSVAWSRTGSYAVAEPATPAQEAFDDVYFDGASDFRLPAGHWRLTAAVAGVERANGRPGCAGEPRHELVTSIEITVLPGPTAAATPPSTVLPATLPEVNPPVRCGRLDPGDCEDAIGLVAPLEPEAMLTSRAIVADDACDPGEVCPTRLRAIVAFLLPEEGRWRAYLVTGTSGPETVERWQQPPPDGITALIEAGPDLGEAGVLGGIPTLAPRKAAELECPAALATGTLVEDPRWGLALATEGVSRKVTWPFGWSARRQGTGAWLVDATGDEQAHLGDELEVSGGDVACGGVTVTDSGPVAIDEPAGGLVARDTVGKDPFELTLAVDRTAYTTADDILPVATLALRGGDRQVTVGHGGSPMTFSVREVGGQGRAAIGGNDSICLISTWTRDAPEVFAWQRGGSWSEGAPSDHDRFVRGYVEDGPDGGLRLPAGTWELAATLDANVGGCGPSNPLTATVRIQVLEGPSANPSPEAAEVLGPVVRCVRVDADDCEGSVTLARDVWPDALAAAELVLVVDSCPEQTDCDRQYPFSAFVVLLPQAGTAMGQTVLVHGTAGPEVAELTQTPAMLTDELDELAEQGFGALFPVATTLPRAGADHPCDAAIVGGTLAEDPITGLGFRDRDAVVHVTWPFGWAGVAKMVSSTSSTSRARCAGRLASGSAVAAAGAPTTRRRSSVSDAPARGSGTCWRIGAFIGRPPSARPATHAMHRIAGTHGGPWRGGCSRTREPPGRALS